MSTTAQPESKTGFSHSSVTIKVVGVGGAGTHIVERLIAGGMPAAAFAVVNTDATSMEVSSAPQKVLLENKLLRGLGTGGDPDRGRAAAEEQFPRLRELCSGSDVVFLVAGLGGGAGTGISPVLARAARETGALVLGFVTTPFDCEGNRRQSVAFQGLDELKSAADAVICLPNQRVFKLIDENTSVMETFNITGGFLADGVRGVRRLFNHGGPIEVNFSDFSTLMRGRHSESAFAVAEAEGPARARDAVEKLLAHPMIDHGHMLTDADAVLVSLLGGPDMTMAEVNRISQEIQRHCEHGQFTMGASIDESFRGRLALTLVAARKNGDSEPVSTARTSPASVSLSEQLLPKEEDEVVRPVSRFVAPAPSMPREQIEQLLARQDSEPGRRGKRSQKLHQPQLPLQIISRGRFEKSEPTIHKGEDLDVPTYIRRGVPLN